MNTCTGTSANDVGKFSLQVPQGMENAKVIISSLGYQSDTIEVQKLKRGKGKVTLKPKSIELSGVEIMEYSTARKLMEAVFDRVPQNYRTQDAIGIWYYRNRQSVNDSLFVKSEGLMRNYMPPYGEMLSLPYVVGSPEWNENLFRVYQSLDCIFVYNKAYWRSLVGPEALDSTLNLRDYNKPSDCWRTIGSDFVNYIRRSAFRFLSRKSKFNMETLRQDGEDFYRITVAFQPRGLDYCDTAIMIINKKELAIVDAVVVHPYMSYMPKSKFLRDPMYNDMISSTRYHFRYSKYNGQYQLDFIQRKFECRLEFSPKAKETGCRTPYLEISSEEECILAEHTYEGVDNYKRRYYDNKHPRTKENLEETERILRQPHNVIPW